MSEVQELIDLENKKKELLKKQADRIAKTFTDEIINPNVQEFKDIYAELSATKQPAIRFAAKVPDVPKNMIITIQFL